QALGHHRGRWPAGFARADPAAILSDDRRNHAREPRTRLLGLPAAEANNGAPSPHHDRSHARLTFANFGNGGTQCWMIHCQRRRVPWREPSPLGTARAYRLATGKSSTQNNWPFAQMPNEPDQMRFSRANDRVGPETLA